MLAQCLGMDSAQIRVIKPFVGGGFGARVEALNFEIVTAAAGARRRRHGEDAADARGVLPHPPRPARDRHPAEARHERRRRITACDCEVVQRGGAYGGYGMVTILYAGALLHALYRFPP